MSSAVQLVNSFGVILVVLILALLLGHRLPLLVWPCAFLMTGGAIMGARATPEGAGQGRAAAAEG